MTTDPIAVAVAAELERRGMSIRELARTTEIDVPTISRWLTGERAIRLDARAALLDALGLELRVIRRQARKAKG